MSSRVATQLINRGTGLGASKILGANGMSMLWTAVQVTPERLEAIKRDPSGIQPMLNAAAADSHACQLDKAWNGVHWLLSGQLGVGANVETKVIYGGTKVGEDLGYGPARFLTAQEVREAGAALDKFSPDSLRQRYDPERMDEAGVYPSGWSEDKEQGLKWLPESCSKLAHFLADATAKGNAIITFLY